jgi:hypothetical protein
LVGEVASGADGLAEVVVEVVAWVASGAESRVEAYFTTFGARWTGL